MSVKIGDRIYENGKEFIAVEFASNLTENKGTLIRLGEEIEKQVVLFRHQGKLFCLSNICPHRHQPSIYRGFVENGCVTCPEHFWTYRLDTGRISTKSKELKNSKHTR